RAVACVVVLPRAALETFDEALVVELLELDLPPAERAVQTREIVRRERLRTGDVVDAALVTGARDDRRRNGRAVLARDVGDLPGAAVVRERAGGDRRERLGDLVLGVEAVTQHGPREPGGGERLLGRVMARRDRRRVRRLGLQTRRVDHVPDSRGLCGG